jgi:hypothetical protein
MAGQGLLGGCDRAWTHDCMGYEPGPTDDGPFGGVVCHCPCHRLERELAELRELVSSSDARGSGDVVPGTPWTSQGPAVEPPYRPGSTVAFGNGVVFSSRQTG